MKIKLTPYQVPPAAGGERGAEEARLQAGGQDQEAGDEADPGAVGQEAAGGDDLLHGGRRLSCRGRRRRRARRRPPDAPPPPPAERHRD